MPSKAQIISTLYQKALQDLSSYSNWTAFLRCASWQYKYPFEDQVLIYAQRPEATACAEMEVWNKKLRRWVNRGAKGIALLRERGDRYYLNYVFDAADTNSFYGNELKLWKYSDRYETAVIETLENSYGNLEVKTTLIDAVICAAHNAVQDNKADYLYELKQVKDDSMLEDLDEMQLDVEFCSSAEASVAYMLLNRMGIAGEDIFNDGEFGHIIEFSTVEAISVLGNMVSRISEEALRSIAETVRAEEKIFAQNRNGIYNRSERNDENENRIQPGGRLPAAEPDSAGGKSELGQIRTASEGVPQGTPAEPVLGAADEGRAAEASVRDGQGGGGTGGADGAANGQGRGNGRENEGGRPHEMGGADEQLQTFGGGTGASGGSVQLSFLDSLPTVEQQQKNVREAEQMSFAFSVPQQVIDEVLCDGTNEENSVLEICIEFSKNKSMEEKAAFLQKLYDTDGKGFILDGVKVSAWWDEAGIRIAFGGSAQSERATLLSWEAAAERIDALLDLGRYAPKDLLLQMKGYEYQKTAEIFWYMKQDLNYEAYPELNTLFEAEVFQSREGFPKDTARIAEHLKTAEGLDETKRITEKLCEMYRENPDIMRSRFHNPLETNTAIGDLYLPRKEYAAESLSRTSPERFISEDEINNILTSGSGVSEGKYRIYRFFDSNSDKAGRIKFLKKEYGTGGSYNGKSNESHDAKGIEFSHGNIFAPYAKTLIKWEQAERRINSLIQNGRYLNPKEIEFSKLHDSIAAPVTERDISKAANGKKYELGFGELGNGVTVWNRLEEVNHDYKTVAHISEEGEVTYYEDMPDEVKTRIERQAELEKAEYEKRHQPQYSKWYAEYIELKSSHPDAILMYRVGDFYEMFEDDAVNSAQALEIALTGRDNGAQRIPMCGVPYHTLEKNIKILSEKGYKVAVAEITEDGRHEVVRTAETDIIGKELMIGDRKYVVDSISGEEAVLRDITFQNGTGFPIFRSESVDFVRARVEEQSSDKIKLNTVVIDLTPKAPEAATEQILTEQSSTEQSSTERRNFRITNDELGYGGQKEKFRMNMEAISVLKQCESENRLATPEEQEILSRYVGWGGLPEVFDQSKDNWHSEYAELSASLTSEEYDQARASTLNAHYTSPTIIKAMYKALENMGFEKGNILEPSCGIGNFMGLIPESMRDSKIYGVELDSITGRIARQLYQQNDIKITGFENADFPDSFFDAAIGNVPFGNYKISEKRYDKNNFLIHDFFFAKALDKVRPGGVVAFITTKGTLDKQNSSVRKYIAQRAELLGAIRLPNDAFQKNANTRVTADIIFLQKRDRMVDIEPEWVHLGTLENGITVNQYFAQNSKMILGEMTEENSLYGKDYTCKAFENANLSEQLEAAIQNIHGQITEYEIEDIAEDNSIPADPNVRNFSYTVVNGEIYYRENSRMTKAEVSLTAANRIKGLIEIRDCVRSLIELQSEGYSDEAVSAAQEKLNRLYDDFTAKYGLINSRGNNIAFSPDSSYYLLCSLEILNEDGELERKADMFTKRTIGAKREISHVDTASEALAVSLGEKARVDMELMSQLTGKTEAELYSDLKGVVFLNPQYTEGVNEKYLTADEYLSGNVRQKLHTAELLASTDERFKIHAEALKAVQPKDLTASEITVRLGSTWVPTQYIRDFTFELLSTTYWQRQKIDVKYSHITGNWAVTGKSLDKANPKVFNTYGTQRINAYKIIEETLNLKDVRIFDYVEDENGNKKAVLNPKETAIAQQKQEQIKEAFQNWIWKTPERREHLCKIYNEKFNSIRPREYDGSHITFSGMNPEICLRQHQKNAVARVLYGGNTLLGHVVGAGKTWTMAAAAMESRRLGLCSKPLFVVPNHLTEQWAAEFLQLYPAANILVATKKDFETKNRKKFCGRIATGDYDAVIIGHSQFEKIPMSIERQERLLNQQRDEIMDGIIEAKANREERFTVKQLEKTKRSIEAKIAKLNDQSRKDDVVTFEELGVDRLFVDESHFYKNLFVYTKMRNVGGISQTDAQKSSDMFMKCRYFDELTGSKGVIFATGTPISNSMVEMYTIQRYLQYSLLEKNDLVHFDAWASTFGETVTAIELAPEGSGYRAKTRFARFFNLPELISMFKETADIQTSDMLNLPVPKAEYHNIPLEPSGFQRDMVAALAERAEKVRSGNVDPRVDNMLAITNDGRKLALDQRIINEILPDDENSKSSVCAGNAFDIWQKTADFKGTQLVFCDLSTPKNDGKFNIYSDIRSKLMKKGIPENEIAFIHDADTEVKKKELFAKVRRGDVRILLGSTQKMGAGTNVQNLLYALHNVDCPWRPSDLERAPVKAI